ncbi:MAG: SET domain-containing protein-lysine N-methyltransferase [Nanoarchaeota archaeon]|nr:SET domain-containing protein-lysine N-methyltransferase [Nanoarchaeota archaeon]
MNPWIIITSSKFGKGAIAAVDIPKGTKIIQYKGKLVSKELGEKLSDKHRDQITPIGTGTLWLFTLNDNYDIDGSRQANEARYINHSCEPNCEAINYDDEEIWIESIKDIKKGEELNYDYGFDEPDERFPCFCGSKNCRGWIVSSEYEFKKGEKERLQKEYEEWLAEEGFTKD